MKSQMRSPNLIVLAMSMISLLCTPSQRGRAEAPSKPPLPRIRVAADGRGRGQHHEDQQALDLPGPRPDAVDRLGGRRPALRVRRGGRLHCLDAKTGRPQWIHDARCEVWGSTLAADGKVYMPTSKGLWVLAAGKELKVLGRVNLGAKVRRLAGGRQRHAVRRHIGRMAVGRPLMRGVAPATGLGPFPAAPDRPGFRHPGHEDGRRRDRPGMGNRSRGSCSCQARWNPTATGRAIARLNDAE